VPLQFAVAETADRPAETVLQIGENRHLGGRRRGPIAPHGALQRSEQSAERGEFRLAQRLATKHQDVVMSLEGPQLRDSRIAQLLP